MTVVYNVKLRNPDGIVLNFTMPNASFIWTLSEMAVGSLQMTIPGGLVAETDITPESRLELWRRIDKGASQLVGGQWLVNLKSIRGNSQNIYLEAVDFNGLLDNRIIDYPAATEQVTNAYTDKTDEADNVIKAFVRENLSTLATDTARRISGLTVTADVSAAPSITKQASRKSLLTTLQDIALDSLAQGTYLTWGWLFEENNVTFDTRTVAWGVNHGSTGSDTLIINRERGSLLNPEMMDDYTRERNVIKIGGMGEGSGRVIGSATSDRATATPFSRKEYFTSGTNTDSTATLNAEANAKLMEYRARRTLTARLAETEALRYGINVNFGDVVIAEYAGHSFDCHLSTVKGTVRGGVEELEIGLKGEEII